MKKTVIIMLIALTLTACSLNNSVDTQPLPSATQVSVSQPTSVPTQIPTAIPAQNPTQALTEALMMEDSQSSGAQSSIAYKAPDWTSLSLTDANTGESFTLADYAGKTIFVHPMATWRPYCRSQQIVIKGIYSQLDADSVLVLSLSTENNLPPEQLAGYALSNGFDWKFAVVTDEMLTALVDQFGRSVASPPSVPHFLIYPDGSVSDLSLGELSGDSILALLEQA